MTDISRKFSLAVRVDYVSPGHVRLSVFSAMILAEYYHHQATRAKSGDLVLRVNEFAAFLDHVKPHLLFIRDDEMIGQLKEFCGVELVQMAVEKTESASEDRGYEYKC